MKVRETLAKGVGSHGSVLDLFSRNAKVPVDLPAYFDRLAPLNQTMLFHKALQPRQCLGFMA
jgi:hypothetical protein